MGFLSCISVQRELGAAKRGKQKPGYRKWAKPGERGLPNSVVFSFIL
jgi:hypothetical protein